MKDLLFRQVKVIDPGGPHHDALTDIRVRDGQIVRVAGRQPKDKAQEVRVPGMHVSPGWVDLSAHFRDPGEEYKEGILRGLDAAAAGGYTAVAVLPSTRPAVDTAQAIGYLLRNSATHPVRALPLGAITQGCGSDRLADLFDMHQAGAVGFTDDQHGTDNSRLMLLALQYVGQFDGTIMVFPQDSELRRGGQMNEGPMSTRLGLKGIPAMAERIRLQRDLELLDYSGSRMHVVTLSTADGVELVRAAKARKARVTASVPAHLLMLDDGCLRGFETNYKVMPPLRDGTHIEALREGLKDGTIDAVVSDHRPEDVEHKVMEFSRAAFGVIGLETAFAATHTCMKGRLSLARIVQRFCHGPRKVLGMEVPHIAEGATAELSLFDPEKEWTFTEADIVSRSRNSPFLGQPFTGRPLGILARGTLRWSPAISTPAAV